MARLPGWQVAVVATAAAWLAATVAAATPGGGEPDLRALSRRFAELEKQADLSGAVLVARHGRVLFERAYGEAERAFGVRNRLQTRFNLGSMNKMFTALAVLRLVEAGRIDLDAPLSRAWPAYPDRTVAERITVRQLLNHTSGLGSYWEGLAQQPLNRFNASSDYLPLCAGGAREHEPGTTFSYSNCGYLVLGLLLETVTGEDYFQHIRRTVYAPLGMRDSDCYRVDTVTPDVALGYTRAEEEPGVWRSNVFDHVLRGGPAGGCYSTVHDLLRFGEALRRGDLLGPGLMELYTRGTQDYPLGRYALGVSEQFINGRRIIGHSGGHVGIASELLVFPDSGHVAVILTNGDVDAFWHARHAVTAALVGRDPNSQAYWNTLDWLRCFDAQGADAARAFAQERGGAAALRGSLIEASVGIRLHRGQDAQALALAELWSALDPQSDAARERLATARRIAAQRAAAR